MRDPLGFKPCVHLGQKQQLRAGRSEQRWSCDTQLHLLKPGGLGAGMGHHSFLPLMLFVLNTSVCVNWETDFFSGLKFMHARFFKRVMKRLCLSDDTMELAAEVVSSGEKRGSPVL